jgi:hypothetical protein
MFTLRRPALFRRAIECCVTCISLAVGTVNAQQPGCEYPNCDRSVTAPVLNVADLSCFLRMFADGDPYANCDGSTIQPILNVADYTCFLQRFSECAAPTDASCFNVTPNSGRLGTVMTIVYACGGVFSFDASTEAFWSGTFTPTGGSATAQFSVAYSAAQVHEQSATSAQVILGEGTFTNRPNVEVLNSGGTLNGVLTLASPTSGVSVSKSLVTQIAGDAGRFERVEYPGGPGGTLPPVIAGEPATLQILLLSLKPDPAHPPAETLRGSTDCHFAAVVRVLESSLTGSSFPASMTVELVSYTAAGAQFDRLTGVQLLRNDNDGDPTYITYTNDLAKSLIIVDTPVNRAEYPEFYLLFAPADGSAVIVPTP